MNNILTMSMAKIAAFLNNIEHSGVSKNEILSSAGIEPSLINAPDHRLTVEEVNRIFLTATKLTNNENIGLHQGERLSRGFSNILGYVLMNCVTLGETAQKYVKYEKIVDETSITELHYKDNLVMLSIMNIAKTLHGNRALSDFKISGMLSYTRILSGEKVVLRQVYFDHDQPEDLSEYQRIFNCQLFFGQPRNMLVFNEEILQLPVIDPNRELLNSFEGIAGDLLDKIATIEPYTKKVLKIIATKLNGELPQIDTVARQLAVSVRSLQDHLKKEGTSYLKLVAEVQKDLAVKYLKDRSASIAEIAFALGFSETSAFNRAFKKWTSFTPCEFRSKIS